MACWPPAQASNRCWSKRRGSCSLSRLVCSPGSSVRTACCSNMLQQRSSGHAPSGTASAGGGCSPTAGPLGLPGDWLPSLCRSLHSPGPPLVLALLAPPLCPAARVALGVREAHGTLYSTSTDATDRDESEQKAGAQLKKSRTCPLNAGTPMQPCREGSDAVQCTSCAHRGMPMRTPYDRTTVSPDTVLKSPIERFAQTSCRQHFPPV